MTQLEADLDREQIPVFHSLKRRSQLLHLAENCRKLKEWEADTVSYRVLGERSHLICLDCGLEDEPAGVAVGAYFLGDVQALGEALEDDDVTSIYVRASRVANTLAGDTPDQMDPMCIREGERVLAEAMEYFPEPVESGPDTVWVWIEAEPYRNRYPGQVLSRNGGTGEVLLRAARDLMGGDRETGKVVRAKRSTAEEAERVKECIILGDSPFGEGPDVQSIAQRLVDDARLSVLEEAGSVQAHLRAAQSMTS